MILTDFDMGAMRGFASRRDISLLCRPVVEAFRYELASRPRVEAPFNKLFIEMTNVETPDAGDPSLPYAELLLNVVVVQVGVAVSDLLGSIERKNATLLDVTEAAFDLIRRDLGWSSEELYDIARTLRAREKIGLIELGALKRDRKTGRSVRALYEVTEESSAVDVIVLDRSGVEIRRERVAFSDQIKPLEMYFPVRSAVVKDGLFVLRDRERRPLAVINVRDD